MKNDKKKDNYFKRSGIGLALWVIAAIGLVVLFIINQDKILSNLKETNFFDAIGKETPPIIENTVPKTEEKNDIEAFVPLSIEVEKPESVESEKTETQPKQNEKTKTDTKVEEKTATQEKPVLVPTMNIKLYFMTINSNGSVSRVEVVRAMKKSDSPLVDSINALIVGPNQEERQKGLISLVNPNAKLISASIKNGVATLNFTNEFETNEKGIDALRAQLQQIVYTATAFSTVDSVQFIIDSEKKEYLGQEGVWIGTPLTRNSF